MYSQSTHLLCPADYTASATCLLSSLSGRVTLARDLPIIGPDMNDEQHRLSLSLRDIEVGLELVKKLSRGAVVGHRPEKSATRIARSNLPITY